MLKKEFLQKIQPQTQALMQQFGISALYLFGSAARDEARETSDVDILVEFSRPIGLIEFIQLKNTLERLLDTPVDLSTRRSLKNHITETVFREAIRVA